MKHTLAAVVFVLFSNILFSQQNTRDSIYHGNWIDLNKNGKMDIYENPLLDIESRIKDLLSQMTLEEKTCQTATLYGFGRVLKDELLDWPVERLRLP